VQHTPKLPFASSLCGACAEVCPVKIDIPQVLLDLRADVKKSSPGGLERLAFRAFAWLMTHPRTYRLAIRWGRRVSHYPSLMRLAPPVAAWMSEREMPPLAERSFAELWKARARKS
jgi:L-lactate dehydrogenase complex protein LldF